MKRSLFVVIRLLIRQNNEYHLCLNDNASLSSLLYLFYLYIFFHLSQNSLTNCRAASLKTSVVLHYSSVMVFIIKEISSEFQSAILHIEAKLLHVYCISILHEANRNMYFLITLMFRSITN